MAEELSLDPEAIKSQRRVDGLARWLDDSFQILGIRFGWDSLLGFVPVLGDTFTMVLSFYILAEAARAGASKAVITRMLGNIAADSIFGAIPIAGDVFDVGFKSNRRNVRILSEHLRDPQRVKRRSRWILASVLLGSALIGLGFLTLAVLIASWVGKKLGSL